MTGHPKAVAATSMFHSVMLVKFKVNKMCSFGTLQLYIQQTYSSTARGISVVISVTKWELWL